MGMSGLPDDMYTQSLKAEGVHIWQTTSVHGITTSVHDITDMCMAPPTGEHQAAQARNVTFSEY